MFRHKGTEQGYFGKVSEVYFTLYWDADIKALVDALHEKVKTMELSLADKKAYEDTKAVLDALTHAGIAAQTTNDREQIANYYQVALDVEADRLGGSKTPKIEGVASLAIAKIFQQEMAEYKSVEFSKAAWLFAKGTLEKNIADNAAKAQSAAKAIQVFEVGNDAVAKQAQQLKDAAQATAEKSHPAILQAALKESADIAEAIKKEGKQHKLR